MARRIAKDTVFAKNVDEWKSRVEADQMTCNCQHAGNCAEVRLGVLHDLYF